MTLRAFDGMNKLPFCLICNLADTELEEGCTRSFPEMLSLSVIRACIDIGIDKIVSGFCPLHMSEHNARGASMHRELDGEEPS
jgi:hypothetical protein